MKVVALTVVLTLVLGCQCATNCHWGPSYWCQSKVTAEECGGTQYCKDNVWKKAMVSKPQGGIECDLCTIVVDFLEKELLTNKTEAEVKQAVLDFCNSTGPLATTCANFVNDEFDKIWQILVNGGSDACTALGFCSSSVQEVPRPLKKTQLNIECDLCEEIAQKVLDYVESNFTKKEIKVEIKKVCPYMGGFAPECRMLIDTFFDEIWNAATKEMTAKEICQELKLCSASRLALTSFMAKRKVLQAGLCDMCKLVVKFIQPFVDGNSSEDEVKDALEKLCSILPGNVSSECDSLVKSYFDIIWDILKQEVDSGEICTMIKLCNDSKTAVFAKSVPPLHVPQDTVCDVCKLITGFLQPFVDSATTEAEVKAAVQSVCSLLPSGFRSTCNDTVNQYFDVIWQLLKNEVDGDEVCKQTGLCNGTKTYLKQSAGDDVCDACKIVVKYLRDIVDNNATEAEAKALVEEVCDKAGPLKDECDSMIDSYFPMVWKLLQSYVDDDQICAEIKLCANVSTTKLLSLPRSPIVQVQNAKLGGVFCMLCELVMKELTSMLDTNTTEQAIEDALDKVCSVLPSSFGEDCTHFVDKYAPEIIQLILSGVAGKAVCTALGLCVLQEKQFVAVDGIEECVICKTVLELAKALIASKSAETKVDEVVENLCKVVPSGIRDECKDFIETYGPQVIQLLESAIDPETICTDIKVCSKTAGAALMA